MTKTTRYAAIPNFPSILLPTGLLDDSPSDISFCNTLPRLHATDVIPEQYVSPNQRFIPAIRVPCDRHPLSRAQFYMDFPNASESERWSSAIRPFGGYLQQWVWEEPVRNTSTETQTPSVLSVDGCKTNRYDNEEPVPTTSTPQQTPTPNEKPKKHVTFALPPAEEAEEETEEEKQLGNPLCPNENVLPPCPCYPNAGLCLQYIDAKLRDIHSQRRADFERRRGIDHYDERRFMPVVK